MAQDAKEAVMSCIKAMDARNYAEARQCVAGNVRVTGPMGEAFRGPNEFLKMMEEQRGNYGVKKIFIDGAAFVCCTTSLHRK